MGFALKILKNAGIKCEGITTPGGFGNRALKELSQGTLEACRDVFNTEIPHYFRHIFTDERSVAPRVELASGLDEPDPRCVVSIIGCTGDWFGGWDGLTAGSVDQFITADLKRGRLPEVIARGEPAIMVCHWPGMYFNGQETGFKIFQQIVERLNAGFDRLMWLKLGEIARYWAVRELTTIECARDGGFAFKGPFACPSFTVEIQPNGETEASANRMRLSAEGTKRCWRRPARCSSSKSGAFVRERDKLVACFNLPRGALRLEIGAG